MTSPALVPATTPPATLTLTYGHGDSSTTPYRSQTSESVRLWSLWIAGMGVACFNLLLLCLLLWILSTYVGLDPLLFFVGFRSYWIFPGSSGPPDFMDVVGDCLKATWPLIPAGMLLFTHGAILRALVRPVADARPTACYAAFFMIAPLSLPLFAAVLFSLLGAFAYGTSFIQPVLSHEFLLLLLITLFATWLLVLCVRISVRLFSVARIPGAGTDLGTAMLLPPTTTTTAADPTLPHSRLLNYLAPVDTATRVRRIACVAVRVAGIVAAVASLAAISSMIFAIMRQAAAWSAGPLDFPNLFAATQAALADNLPTLGLLLIILPGNLLIVFAKPIRRGRALPSVLAAAYLAAAGGTLLIATAVISDILIAQADSHREWSQLFWLLAIAPVTLLVLLLKDLCAFLIWIARNPVMEKAPVRFLP